VAGDPTVDACFGGELVTYAQRSTMLDFHHVWTLTVRVARPSCRVAGLFRFTIDSNLHAAGRRKRQNEHSNTDLAAYLLSCESRDSAMSQTGTPGQSRTCTPA
jgi:hypothetical protein